MGLDASPDDAAERGRTERLAREYFSAVWNGTDVGFLDSDRVHPEFVMHHQSDTQYTAAELGDAWTAWHTAFDDLDNAIEELIATPDRAVVRYRFTATHAGEILGVPATGAPVVLHVEDARPREEWAMDDVAGLQAQLDAAA